MGVKFFDEIVEIFNPETSILIQKRHPYTGNLHSETSGDSKSAFLHCGDVLENAHSRTSNQVSRLRRQQLLQTTAHACGLRLSKCKSHGLYIVDTEYANSSAGAENDGAQCKHLQPILPCAACRCDAHASKQREAGCYACRHNADESEPEASMLNYLILITHKLLPVHHVDL